MILFCICELNRSSARRTLKCKPRNIILFFYSSRLLFQLTLDHLNKVFAEDYLTCTLNYKMA